jgi:WD40 repeat protein
VAFSPDGQLVATSHHNSTVVGLWNIATGEKITAVTGHDDRIWQVAISPDGLRLASCSGSLRMSAALLGEEDADENDFSLRLWGVPDDPSRKDAEASQARRPLKRLGKDEEEAEEEAEGEGILKPVQDLFNRFSR